VILRSRKGAFVTSFLKKSAAVAVLVIAKAVVVIKSSAIATGLVEATAARAEVRAVAARSTAANDAIEATVGDHVANAKAPPLEVTMHVDDQLATRRRCLHEAAPSREAELATEL